MSVERRRIRVFGRWVTTPIYGFWEHTRTVQDPQIPNLPLEDPAPAAAITYFEMVQLAKAGVFRAFAGRMGPSQAIFQPPAVALTPLLSLQDPPRRAQAGRRDTLLPTLALSPTPDPSGPPVRPLRTWVGAPREGVLPPRIDVILVPDMGWVPADARRLVTRRVWGGYEVVLPAVQAAAPPITLIQDLGGVRRLFRHPTTGQLMGGMTYPVVGIPNWYVIILDD